MAEPIMLHFAIMSCNCKQYSLKNGGEGAMTIHQQGCEIQGSHGSDSKNCHFMGCDAVQCGRRIQTFQRILLHPSP
jgi:hypothetical protein